MSPIIFKNPKRQQDGILARGEARALHWMAARVPDWINSDHLTGLGFLAMVAAGVAYGFSRHNPLLLHAVNLCLVLNWLGDSLDGTLARYRNRTRPRYGFYVDHILDTFSMFFLISGLALSGYMSRSVAGLVLVSYFMLCINVYLATHVTGTFKISFWKLSPTELRLLLIVGNCVLLFDPAVGLLEGRYRLFDVSGIVACGLMAVILITSTIKNIQVLYNAERLP